MTVVRRLTALFVVLLVAMYPLALERCRTACTENTAPAAAAPSHACHESGRSGPSVSSAPHACGQSNEARAADITALAASKPRPQLAAAIPLIVSFTPLRSDVDPVAAGAILPSTAPSNRNLPLRL